MVALSFPATAEPPDHEGGWETAAEVPGQWRPARRGDTCKQSLPSPTPTVSYSTGGGTAACLPPHTTASWGQNAGLSGP